MGPRYITFSILMKISKKSIILGIDTSCDDTCIAVLEIKNGVFKILSDIISSQVKLHQKYGGVYPALAKREHIKNLPLVFKKAQKEACDPKIGYIAVTMGPGLEPCLWQGINFAQDLAKRLKLPIIPVNHIEAHIIANFIESKPKNIFPAVCLVVSGGHTQLILMKGFENYQTLGETCDDAAGECFDKTARILGLGYPGGPLISSLAKKDTDNLFSIKLPRPMISHKNYDFSFSGLKTAVLYDFKNRPEKIKKSKKYIGAMCFETQQAIIDVLIYKTLKAAKNFRVKNILIGGGVSANKELRSQFKEKFNKEIPESKLYIPSYEFSTDNGAMIAATASFHLKEALDSSEKRRTCSPLSQNLDSPPGSEIEANGNLRI